ncbi:hypothetical protein BKA69DRAFT_1090500 [Paraphysoderma sedebokerense]|nr:hypothetical protein BKA69DRAFT_1090500 [Paraphysoderma sedebokerense]
MSFLVNTNTPLPRLRHLCSRILSTQKPLVSRLLLSTSRPNPKLVPSKRSEPNIYEYQTAVRNAPPNDVFLIIQQMIDSGVYNSWTIQTAITRLGQTNRYDLIRKVENRLHKSQSFFSEDVWLALLNEHSSQRNWTAVLNTFDYGLSSVGKKVNPYAITRKLNALAKLNRIDDLKRSFQIHKHGAGVVAYNIILGHLCRSHYYNEALKLYSDMKNENCRPSLITYTILLETSAKKRDKETFKALYQDFMASNVTPDTRFCNIIIKACCQVGSLADAEMFFTSMKNSGVVPDLHTYSILIQWYLKQNDTRKSLDLLKEMKEYNIQPTSQLFLPLLLGHARLGNLEAIFSVIKYMEETGITSDPAIFERILSELGAHKHSNQVFELANYLNDHPDSSNRMTTTSYNVLLKTLVETDKQSLVPSLLNKMSKAGSPPDIVTFNTLIHANALSIGTAAAYEIFKTMEKAGIKPNTTTFNSLLESCVEFGGDLDITDIVLKKMKEYGISKDPGTYKHLMEVYMKRGMIDSGVALKDEMKVNGNSVPAGVYGQLIEYLAKAIHHARSLSFTASSTTSPTLPPTSTAASDSTASDAAVQLDHLTNLAVALTNEVNSARNLTFTTPLLNSLLHLYKSLNQPAQVLQTYNSFHLHNLTPSSGSISLLLTSLMFSRNPSHRASAQSIFHSLLSSSFPLSLNHYEIYIKGQIKHGNFNEAINTLYVMQQKEINPSPWLLKSLIKLLVKNDKINIAGRLEKHLRELFPEVRWARIVEEYDGVKPFNG